MNEANPLGDDTPLHAGASDRVQRISLALHELEQGTDLADVVARYPDVADEVRAHLRGEGAFRNMVTGTPEVLPREFAGYRLEAVLGRGGMGVVYRAFEHATRRWVALKVITETHSSDAKSRARLKREAEAVARLNDPGIVPLYGFGEHGGRYYLAMQLVAGTSLERVLAASQHPYREPREAANLIVAVTKALTHAHEKGVIHRDIKPANILIDSGGRPRLVDFGLAWVSGATRITATEAGLGSPAYMAPEQIVGRSTSTRSDVYSLGAVLYELLTGRPPFTGTWAEVLRKVRADEPVPPHRLNPEVPEVLSDICCVCLRKVPLFRYRGATELAEDLVNWLDSKPVEARPAGGLVRGVEWAYRRPRAALAAGSLGLIAASVLTVSLAYSAELGRANRQLKAQADDLKVALDKSETERARTERAHGHLAQATREWFKAGVSWPQELGGDDQRIRYLEGSATAFEYVLGEKPGDRLAREGAARARFWAGRAKYTCGQYAGAADDFARSASHFGRLVDDFRGELGYRRELASAYTNLADTRKLYRPLGEAQGDYDSALAHLDVLLREKPGDPVYLRDKAAVLLNVGDLLSNDRSKLAQAEKVCSDAIEIWRDLVRRFPEEVHHRSDLANALLHLSNLLQKTGRLAEAEGRAREALTVQDALAKQGLRDAEFRERLAASYLSRATLSMRLVDGSRGKKAALPPAPYELPSGVARAAGLGGTPLSPPRRSFPPRHG